MNPAFAALIAGLFIGWWIGVITASCCAFASVCADEESQFPDEDGRAAALASVTP